MERRRLLCRLHRFQAEVIFLVEDPKDRLGQLGIATSDILKFDTFGFPAVHRRNLDSQLVELVDLGDDFSQRFVIDFIHLQQRYLTARTDGWPRNSS